MRTQPPSHRLSSRSLPPDVAREIAPAVDENLRATRLMASYRDTRDAAAFEQLYALTRESVLTWLKGLLGREQVALDPNELLQDTFINVYRYPSGFRDDHGGSYRVWVRTIAGNVLRRAAVRRARLQVQQQDVAPLEPVDRSHGPVQLADEVEAAERLRRAWVLFLLLYAEAWKELSQRDRRTLHLVEVEGLSYQQAGEVLAVGRSNMKMIVFRSRKRIARRMRDALQRAGGRGRGRGPVLVG